jgi:hypothetical protein
MRLERDLFRWCNLIIFNVSVGQLKVIGHGQYLSHATFIPVIIEIAALLTALAKPNHLLF